MRILGIDPGVSGAWGLLTPHGASVGDLPVGSIGSTKQISPGLLGALLSALVVDVVVLEDNRANSTNGSKANFSMGLSMGVCLGVVGALDLSLVRLRPQVWKKAVGIGTVKGTAAQRKEASRLRAIEVFPALLVDGLHRKMDHNRAEALLLAEAYRRGR